MYSKVIIKNSLIKANYVGIWIVDGKVKLQSFSPKELHNDGL